MAASIEEFNNAKKYSKQRGLNLKQTALKSGLSENAIYGWQRYSAAETSVAAVARTLGVKPADIHGNNADTGTPSHVTAATSYDLSVLLSDPGTKLLYNGRELDQRDRETIGRVLDR